MVKVICDMCKKPIDYNIDGVNLDFNSFGVVNFKSHCKDGKQLCIACATRVENWINAQCEKNVAEIIGANGNPELLKENDNA